MDRQPDLFDFIPYEDGGRQGAPPPAPETTDCKWCHHHEPNGWLLRNNHAPDSYRANQTTWCTAMDLTLRHLIYWQQIIDGQTHNAQNTSELLHAVHGRGQNKIDPHQAQERDLQRALTVWANRLGELHAHLDAHGIPRSQPTRPSEPPFERTNPAHPSPTTRPTPTTANAAPMTSHAVRRKGPAAH